jgi:SAM-dependent methyltransferase
MHLYADAEIYDILHQEDTLADARMLARILKDRAVRSPQTWLEPACGSGRYLRALQRLGHHAVGFDLRPEMVAYVRALQRKNAPSHRSTRVRVFRAAMESFDLPAASIDGALNLINTIRHLASDAAMLAHLRRVRACLRTHGVYVVGISLAAYGIERETEDVWVARRRTTKVTQVVQFIPPDLTAKGPWSRRERVVSHLTIEQRGAPPEHRDSTYWLRTYSKSQWESLVARAGFEVASTLDNHGQPAIAHEPGYFVYVLAPK